MKVKIPILNVLTITLFLCGFIVPFCCLNLPVFGQSDVSITITIKEGQQIRDIAKVYLDDANLWEEILRHNSLDSVVDIKPGMKLKIPKNSISQALVELERASNAIREATEAGAMKFVPNLISKAIQSYDEALQHRKAYDWKACFESAKSAKVDAQTALKQSRVEHDTPTKAIVTYRKGVVESRKPKERWKDAPLNSKLTERQSLRTLVDSFAELLFSEEQEVATRSDSGREVVSYHSGNRLKLGENSRVIFQKMRLDKLKNKQETAVSLIEGDVNALLSGSQKKKLKVNVPSASIGSAKIGGAAKINPAYFGIGQAPERENIPVANSSGIEVFSGSSTNFWVGRNQRSQTVRFANYDGEVEVYIGEDKVVLHKNEGTKIERDGKLTRKEKLLPAPILLFPNHHSTVYRTEKQDEITLRWEPVPGAVSYWLEIALDHSTFSQIVLSRKNIKTTHFVQKQFGLLFSTVSTFSEPLNRKEFPAGLRQAFKANKISLPDSVTVSIKAADSKWVIQVKENEQTYTIRRRGARLNVYQFEDSVYYWRVTAIDKNGLPGAKSQARLFAALTDVDAPYILVSAPKERAFFKNPTIKIIGETERDAVFQSVQIFGEREDNAIFTVDEKGLKISPTGRFEFEVPLTEGLNKITFHVHDQAGNTSTLVRSVTFVPDIEGEIQFTPALPQVEPNHFVTQHTEFTFAGRTEPDAVIDVQSTVGEVKAKTFSDAQGDFAASVPLTRPKNDFELAVTTRAGHRATEQVTVKIDQNPPKIHLDAEPVDVSPVKKIHLKGSVINGTSLKLNDSDVNLLDERFDETIELKPGKNEVRLTATDLVGNTDTLKRTIIFDDEPPKFLKLELSPLVASGGETIQISVLAEDDSGLKRRAKFKLLVGEFEYTGFLKYHRTMKRYQKVVTLPKQAKGKIQLVLIVLEDRYGNRKEYQFK
jgi:hypothetical protein